MISEQNIPSLLMIVVLLISLVRLFILYRFGCKWSAYKIDYAVGATSCILFAILSGLFWSKEIPAGRQVLLWVSTILPPLQAFLRIDFQQHRMKNTPRVFIIVCRTFFLCSSLAKVAIALIGLLVLDSVHLGGLFILFLDYLGVTTWYLWLIKYEIQGRVTIKRVSCYLFVIALLLLITAILGAIWKSWIIALEIQLIIILIAASFEKLVVREKLVV